MSLVFISIFLYLIFIIYFYIYDNHIIIQYCLAHLKSIVHLNYKNTESRRMQIECLTILSIKLFPLLIFTGAKDGKLYTELSDNINVKKGRIIITFNMNAWCTKEIMELWNQKKWRKYIYSLGYMILNLIIINKASMHLNDEVIKEIEKYDTEIIFVPKGMTRILQPLDICINIPFKTLIRKKNGEYCCNKNLPFVKISNNLIINWHSEIWWSDVGVNKTMVKNNSRTTRISNNINVSENYLFKAYEKLKEEIVIEKDIDEKYEIAENYSKKEIKNKNWLS